MNILENIVGWQFLQEPLYRWFMFLGALTAISIAWGGIIAFMK